MESGQRDLVRHILATIAYRGGKALRGLTAEQASARACDGARSIHEIVAHIGDLLAWSVSLVQGREAWSNSAPDDWVADIERFYSGLAAIDEHLAADTPIAVPLENLLQGPLADTLTHIGQIAMLRRIAGVPVKGENYFAASVRAGEVGRDQAAPEYEF
jgi:hypothetical protein